MQTAQVLREYIEEYKRPAGKKQESYTHNLTENNSKDAPDLIEHGGQLWLGVLNIPALALELPVNNDWSDDKLIKTPCRYAGSFTDALIICAHDYKFHFGNISNLSPGDRIILTDAKREQHLYAVDLTEIIKGSDIDGMINTPYDLTLFTCTPDGSARVTVRCVKAQ